MNELASASAPTCDAAEAICAQVFTALQQANDRRPTLPLQPSAQLTTVLTANVIQSWADRAADRCTPDADKQCNQVGRRKIFAQRVKALSAKSATTDSMRLAPDIISLQEVRGVDICGRPNVDCNPAGQSSKNSILWHLNEVFPTGDYRVATVLGHESATLPESNADHEVEGDTAILYSASSLKEVEQGEDNQFIETTYTEAEGCLVQGVVFTPTGLDACEKENWKRHAVARLQNRTTNQIFAVASVHLVPREYLKEDQQAQVRRDWAEDLALGLREKYPEPQEKRLRTYSPETSMVSTA